MYIFNYTVTRKDNGTWNFGQPTNMIVKKIAKKEFTFNILYPPEVSGLNLSQVLNTPSADSLPNTNTGGILTVEENSTVDAVCTWDAGNPKADAFFSHRGIEGNTNRSSGQIRYRFAAVGCQDTGLIRCNAPGAKRNKSATLLVRCPPQIQALSEISYNFTAEENVVLNTSVKAHVDTITRCTVTQVDFNKTTNCSSIKVTGVPPDLTVSVRLDNVRKQDQGEWRLTLTNEVGDGNQYFKVNFTSDTTGGLYITLTTPEGIDSGLNDFPYSTTPKEKDNRTEIAVSMMFLTVAAVVGIAMYKLYRQKHARKADEAHEGSEEYVTLRQDHQRESNDLSSPSSYTMTNRGSGILSDVVLPLNAADEGDNLAIRSLDSPYWEVADRVQRSTQEPGGGATHPTDPLYVDAAEVRKRKAEKRKQHLPDEADPMYVDAAEVRRRKAEAKGAASGAAAAAGKSGDETHTYVDITDIQRRKRLARQKKESGEKENLTEEASFNPCEADNDGLARGEEDASVRAPTTTTTRTTSHYAEIQFDSAPSSNRIFRILPRTEYAQIQFNTPPPRPPKRETSEQTASK